MYEPHYCESIDARNMHFEELTKIILNVYLAGDSAYSLPQIEAEIQKDIMANGPVEATFDVYKDFLNYQSGVYQHITGTLLGSQAIKILGWGEHNGTPYWLAANSWNTNWGESGFFKIRRGINECSIETYVVTGFPKV